MGNKAIFIDYIIPCWWILEVPLCSTMPPPVPLPPPSLIISDEVSAAREWEPPVLPRKPTSGDLFDVCGYIILRLNIVNYFLGTVETYGGS